MAGYERYAPALLRKAERMLQSRAAAEDIVHGLFVDLLEKREQPDLPYLYRAVTHRCLTYLRDEQNRARLLAEHDDALRGPVRTACDERVIGTDLLAKVARALDPEALEILVCHYFDDMTQEEIGALLGLSRKTIGKRLERVRDAVVELSGGAEADR